MIKGIYNENEFYTNFYWDSKFLEDLRAKVGVDASAEAAIGALKGLDRQFWSLKEMPEGDSKRLEALVGFYKNVFHALGYSSEPRDHQTSSGQHLSLFLDVKRANTSDLYALLLEQSESGTFETPPIFIGAQQTSESEAEERELSEVLQEELQDSQNPPRWIFVGAPNALFIIERNKWAFGRYLRVEWQEVFLQRDTKPYELLFGVAAKRFLCPDSGSSLHDEFDENSHRHAYEVTTELRESVREAIELLINEMIDQRKEGHQKIYSEDKADDYARELTHDALYYVYRLLFLLYLEAQGDDSELLPLKSEIYRNGYSLEKLLELDYIDIAPNSVESKGHFLFESLEQIFNLIYFGFEPAKGGIFETKAELTGFLVKGIKSDLFDPNAVKHLKGTKLRNGVLLDILKKLSLTRRRERGGRPRARVSYANLGINQLGAVYESLLSYTGFFAQEELHALKPASVKQGDVDNGKELDQVYLAPRTLVDRYRKASEKKYKLSAENTVLDESGNPKVYKKGSFIYRLAGRDRQKLASYYTPESLTKCTVMYALKVLFETKKTLDDLWAIKILEPAMGSGAFLSEAVNQLAEKILDLEVQGDNGDLRSPRAKQKRLWDIKYKLITNNVFGVDLNPTAIELARFSLWLNCVGAGKEPPSFNGKLKVGNSLIGARFKKGADGLFPWLLVADGMMDYDFKRLKSYDEVASQKIQEFREEFLSSRLNSSHHPLLELQIKIERILSLDQDRSEDLPEGLTRLKFCADLWCSAFFLDEHDFRIYPRNHESLLAVYRSVIDGGIDAATSDIRSLVSAKASSMRFFHWELEFHQIMRAGGFDLILGNPPWVAVEWQDSLYLTDINPIPAILELNAADTRGFIESHVDDVARGTLGRSFIETAGYSRMLETEFYRQISGASKNTYKAFDVLALNIVRSKGVIGIIQDDGVLEEDASAPLRGEFYQKLKFHFQFTNERYLFAEVNHRQKFSINVLKNDGGNEVSFDHIGNLFLAGTIEHCYSSPPDDPNPVPLIKNASGEWESKGHWKRIVSVRRNSLELFGRFMNSPDKKTAVFINLHSQPLYNFLEKIAIADLTFEAVLGAGGSVGSQMLNEVNAQEDGSMTFSPGRPESSAKTILSGPHIGAANPFYQQVSAAYKNKSSYEEVDLVSIADDFIPRTVYQLKVAETVIDQRFPNVNGVKYGSCFKLVTRGMVNSANERSLFTAVIPPGVLHINGLRSVASTNLMGLLLCAGYGASLICDAVIRLKNKTNVFPDDLLKLPIGSAAVFHPSIVRRSLSLNGLTKDYEKLWLASKDVKADDSTLSKRKLVGFGEKYRRENALRTPSDRSDALIEIDALVALSFGLSEEDLLQAYQVLFPVLLNYDNKANFDRRAKLSAAYRFFQARGW